MEAGAQPVPRSFKLLLGLPLGVLATMIGGLLALTVVLSSASPSCGEAVGDLNGKVPHRLVPIYQEAAAKFGLGQQRPVDPRRRSIGSRPASAPTSESLQPKPKAGCSSCPNPGRPLASTATAMGSRTPTTPGTRSSPPLVYFVTSGAPENWHDAIFSYNHAEWYVEKVERFAERFSGAVAKACRSAGSQRPAAAATTPSGAVVRQGHSTLRAQGIQAAARGPLDRRRRAAVGRRRASGRMRFGCSKTTTCVSPPPASQATRPTAMERRWTWCPRGRQWVGRDRASRRDRPRLDTQLRSLGHRARLPVGPGDPVRRLQRLRRPRRPGPRGLQRAPARLLEELGIRLPGSV